jgi:hypothetical protein
MKFYYNGTKKTNEPGFASGCVILIGFAALIYFFTLLNDVEDLKDHLVEIIAVSVMGISLLAMLFRKKGELSNRHVVIENDYFKLDKVSVPISSIQLEIYYQDTKFRRYHLRDSEGKIAVFSVFKYDLYRYILEHYPDQTEKFQEHSSTQDGSFISIQGEGCALNYDLDTGKYTVKQENQEVISFLPEIYTYDSKYKKGVPLGKK